MKLKFIFSGVAALLFACTSVSAQQKSETDTTGLRSVTMDEVVVSANKSEESRKKVAQQVEILNSADIQRAQAQNTADLIGSTGSVMVQKSQQGGGSPVLRGFEASRILLVVDGVRMNNLIYRGGHLQNILTVDGGSLDRAEILFGPSSTVYGSDALGGVIHLYSKKPIFSTDDKKLTKVNFNSRFSSVNSELAEHVDFNIGSKKFASLTSITYSKFGDMRGGTNQNPFYTGAYGERPYYVQRFNDRDSLVKNDDRYLQKQSAYTQYNIMQRFGYRQNEHVTHGLNIQYSSSTDVPRYDRLTDVSGGGLKYAEWYYGPQSRLMAAYDLDIKNEAKFFQSIHVGLNDQMIEESRHQRRFNNNNLQHRIENVNVMGANLDMRHTTSKHDVRVGIDAQYNQLESTANQENLITNVSSPLDTRYPDGTNTMMNVAAYFSHSYQINKQLVLNDGVRVGFTSLHSTLVDTSFFHLPYSTVDQKNPVYSGSIGLVHTPADDLKLSFLLSTGFRVPNIDDLSKIFESAAGALIVPNPNLKPEKTVNAEWGVTKIYNAKTRWENTLYYTQMYDAIMTGAFQYNGKDSVMYDGAMSKVFANQNKSKAFIYGFSSTVRSQCTDHLMVSAMINYTYGRAKTDSSDVPLDHISPLMARVQLMYTNGNFSTDFFVNFNGPKKMKDYSTSGEDNEAYATSVGMPAWFTANWRVSYSVCKGFIVQAGVDNIFDTQYRVFSSGINAPGRNVFAAVKFAF